MNDFELSQQDPEKIFTLIESIGVGSYGEVYKAIIKSSGLVCAVKIIPLEQGEDLTEVLNEVNVLKNCASSNIVSYFGCYLQSGFLKKQSIWIAMEYCGGGSVESCYKATKQGLSELAILYIFKEALMGLEYLHGKGHIHRDIKAGNILLTENGDIKLADFGVSTQISRTLMRRNTFIGTPYWMAPEVISAEESGSFYDKKADIWSLGITILEMANCGPPYYNQHPMRALFLIPKNDPPMLDKERFSEELVDLISQHVLVKDPEFRKTAEELLKFPLFSKISTAKGRILMMDLIDKSHVAKKDRQETLHKLSSNTNDVGTLKPEVDISSATIKANNILNNESATFVDNFKGTLVLKHSSETNLPNVYSSRLDSDMAQSKLKISPTETLLLTREWKLPGDVVCAALYGNDLLVGTNDGLFAISKELPNGNIKISPLSSRRYDQITVIQELGLLVSRSGKYSTITFHELSFIDRSIKKGKKYNSSEPKSKKLKETKECLFYAYSKHGGCFYLFVSLPNSILTLKWLPSPHNKWARFKEVGFSSTSEKILISPISNVTTRDFKIFVGFLEGGFKMLDISTATAEDIVFHPDSFSKLTQGGSLQNVPTTLTPNSSNLLSITGSLLQLMSGTVDFGSIHKISAANSAENVEAFQRSLGLPVNVILLGNYKYLFCYKNNGIVLNIQSQELHKLTWRFPVDFTVKLSSDLFLAGNKNSMDIWNINMLSIVHILSLSNSSATTTMKYLFFDDISNRVYFLAEEYKESNHSAPLPSFSPVKSSSAKPPPVSSSVSQQTRKQSSVLYFEISS